MYYFRFEIPTNKDGSVVTYSPGWCGTRDRCAKNEKGILYNDEERWGIGQAEGDYVPDDVTVLTEKEVAALLATAKSEAKEKVYFEDKLAHRYDYKEEVAPTEEEVTPIFEEKAEVQPARIAASESVKWVAMGWCNECNKSFRWLVPVPAGLKCKDMAITVKCPQGHKCVVHIDTSEVSDGR